MKALIYEGPRQMKIRNIDIPVVEPDEVLIQVVYSGICGSELSGYLGRNSLRQPPLIFGHEFSGIIVELGEQAAQTDRLKMGHRVTANPLITCGHCVKCKQGKQQLCNHRKLLSASLPGSNATYIKVKEDFVYVLPDHLSYESGAMIEPAACAVRVADLAGIHASESVLVMGMGPIGLLVLQAMKAHGVKHIIAVDLNEERLAVAKQEGAYTICPKDADALEEIQRLTDHSGVDIAVDAVGSSITRNQCIQSVTSGGKVVFTGLHEAETSLPINDMIRREIQCHGAFAYSKNQFEKALQWMAEGRVGIDQGVVRIPLEEGAEWYEKLLGNAGNVVKVLLDPSV